MKKQTKKQLVDKLNAMIDRLIIKGQTKTAEYKRLERLHYVLTRKWQVL